MFTVTVCVCAVFRQGEDWSGQEQARSSARLDAGLGTDWLPRARSCSLLHTKKNVGLTAAGQSIRDGLVAGMSKKISGLAISLDLLTFRRIEEEIRPGPEKERGAHPLFLILLARRKGLPSYSASLTLEGNARYPLPIGCPPEAIVVLIARDLAASRSPTPDKAVCNPKAPPRAQEHYVLLSSMP